MEVFEQIHKVLPLYSPEVQKPRKLTDKIRPAFDPDRCQVQKAQEGEKLGIAFRFDALIW